MVEATPAAKPAPETAGKVVGSQSLSGSLARAFAAMLGAPLVATAALMIASPWTWFHVFPGVATSGPYNGHLSRDFGCALLLAGAGLLYAAWRPAADYPIVVAFAALLMLHALVHVGEASTMGHAYPNLVVELATVHAPAAVALFCALAWPRVALSRSARGQR